MNEQVIYYMGRQGHSSDHYISPAHAEKAIYAFLKEREVLVAFLTTDSIKYVAQDCLGTWWTFTKKPVKDAQGTWCFLSEDAEQHHKTRTGWWTYKLFNLEK